MRVKLKTAPGGLVQFATEASAHKYWGQPGKAGDVTIIVDLKYLLDDLAGKALFSKGKRAQLCHGAVKVVVRNVREVPA